MISNVVSFGKKLYPIAYPAVKSEYIVCHDQGSAEEQPLADAAFPVKTTYQIK